MMLKSCKRAGREGLYIKAMAHFRAQKCPSELQQETAQMGVTTYTSMVCEKHNHVKPIGTGVQGGELAEHAGTMHYMRGPTRTVDYVPPAMSFMKDINPTLFPAQSPAHAHGQGHPNSPTSINPCRFT